MKKYKQMHMQAMGGFNWFKIVAWREKGRERAMRQLRKLVQKIKGHGFWDTSSVMWLSSGKGQHKNLNRKTPWYCFKNNNGVWTFDFGIPNQKFWLLYRLWLETFKAEHHKFVPIYQMREDYCSYPFTHNVNGIDGINSPEGLEVTLAYMRKATEMYIDVYGKFPRIIPWNERDHYGDGKMFHKIMYDHRAVRDEVVIPLGGKYSDIYPDITLCEGAAGELIEPHGDCPKPGDCDQNSWHGKDGQHRRKGGLVSFKHRVSTNTDAIERLGNMIGSGNAERFFTEDGGGYSGDGNYLAGPFNIPCGDAQQQYEMMVTFIKAWKKHGFMGRFGTFPHECLTKVDGVFVPDYRPRNINWRRIRNGVLKACKEMLGE